MQSDGNLVLQDTLKIVKWASGTSSNLPTHLILQDDGKLVIYDKSNKSLWATTASSTSCQG
jgi:hypothetical protein